MTEAESPEVSEAVAGGPADASDIRAAMREQRRMFLLGGILLVLAGAFAIGAPVAATLTVGLLFGIALIAGGVAHGVHAFGAKCFGSGLLRMLIALLYLVAGLYLVLNLPRGVVTIGLLIGILFVVEGIGHIVQGIQLRPLPGWGWCSMGGIVSLVLGGIIWAGWPYTALWIPGLLVGVNLLFYGVTLLGVWSALGREAPDAAGGAAPA